MLHCNVQVDHDVCRDWGYRADFLSKEPALKLDLGKLCLKGNTCLGHLHIHCMLQGFAEQPQLFSRVHIFQCPFCKPLMLI